MIQLIKNNYKGLLIFVGVILIACAIWILDVRREKTGYDTKLETLKLKNYVDSCNAVKDSLILDANTQISHLKTQDSIRSLNKVNVVKNEKNIKNLSHSALQLAIDTIRPKR